MGEIKKFGMNKGIKYLNLRGLSQKTIDAFDLNYCDTQGNCATEYQPFVDFRFVNSVLFPIKDLYGTSIAVAARNVDEKMYIHSSYSKKKHLYGLNVTHKSILQEKCVFIVEGNFDLLTLYENGITNAVAMLGSKLSLEQISLLVRFADEFIIATDGDIPGRECATKLAQVLDANNIAYKKLNLPSGSDPDSLIRDQGVDAFLGLRPPDLLQRVKGIE